MKVDVITVEQVNIPRFRWWSNWIDVAVFDYDFRPFLLQMQVSRTNAKKFKVISMTGWWYRQADSHAIGNLTQMCAEKEGRG